MTYDGKKADGNGMEEQIILIVDDDRAILELMRDFLETDGFHVLMAQQGEEALAALATHTIHAILLDIMLPGQSGFDLCRKIREQHNVPILFLSARDSDVDKIRGLGLGGDDYIVKSATPGEVVARIKAVLRRYQHGQARHAVTLNFGRLTIDLSAREVFVEGQPIILAAREFDLLQLLAEHPRQVFTHDQLYEHFWGDFGDRHTVTVYIGRLRQKIEQDPAHPEYIVTVWGVGYRFEGVRQ
jgi:DNA-binding response OmpR family regulator